MCCRPSTSTASAARADPSATTVNASGPKIDDFGPSKVIRRSDAGVDLEVIVAGDWEESVIFFPSALRGATDLSDMTKALEPLEVRSVAFNPRGAGRSTRPDGPLTLHDMADDIAAIVGNLCRSPVHLVGHGLGNTFVRCAAADYPDLVATVTLLACGPDGRYTPGDVPRRQGGVQVIADSRRSETERLEALGAFFASGNDPRVWLEDWWPDSGPLVEAMFQTPPEDWWTAGSEVPVLLIQGEEDRSAPLSTGRQLAEELGQQRSRLVELAHCSHAMVPEQGEVITRLLGEFLMEHRTSGHRA